jgi:hypothetical protein
MPSKPPVAPGQRFRDTQLSLFGRPGFEWIVDRVFVGVDGLWHASIVLASDTTERKTITAAVLIDRRRFIPV